MMIHSPTIVLLGGSSLAPWAWRRVVPALEARGFIALTPQLSGTGTDTTPKATVSLDTWIEETSDFIAAQAEGAEVALVAHSFAGYIAAGLLERYPQTVATVIFLDAVLPEPGRSWFQAAGPDAEAFMAGLAENAAVPFFTREQLDQVYPRHGITDTDWAWMQPQLTPQPLQTYTQPAVDHGIHTAGAKLAYVRCLHTAPPAADIDPHTPGWSFRTLATSHWPMVTHPDATASVIAELAAR